MTLGAEYIAALDKVAATIDALPDTGNVLKRFAPIRDWSAVVDELTDDTSGEVRAWYVVPGIPAVTGEVDAVDGHNLYVYQIECYGMQGVADDASGYADAMDRAGDVLDALDSIGGDYGPSGPTVWTFRAGEIRRHDFRYFGKVGVWWTEVVHKIAVQRDLTINW